MLCVGEGIISGKIEPPPVAKLIGFNLRSVKPGRAVLDVQAGPQHWNPLGGLHGGILCDLTDAAMGIAYASTLADRKSTRLNSSHSQNSYAVFCLKKKKPLTPHLTSV